MVFQQARKHEARELAPLVRIEDVRCAIPGDRLLDGVQAEVSGQRVGQLSRQHPAAGPVQDGEQIHEATLHRNVRDVRHPDVIRTRDL